MYLPGFNLKLNYTTKLNAISLNIAMLFIVRSTKKDNDYLTFTMQKKENYLGSFQSALFWSHHFCVSDQINFYHHIPFCPGSCIHFSFVFCFPSSISLSSACTVVYCKCNNSLRSFSSDRSYTLNRSSYARDSMMIEELLAPSKEQVFIQFFYLKLIWTLYRWSNVQHFYSLHK